MSRQQPVATEAAAASGSCHCFSDVPILPATLFIKPSLEHHSTRDVHENGTLCVEREESEKRAERTDR